MKRAFSLLGVIGLTAFVTWLWVSKNQAEEHARHLDVSLAEAEGRMQQLESDMDIARKRIAYLSENHRTSSPAPVHDPASQTAAKFENTPSTAINLISQNSGNTVLPVPVGSGLPGVPAWNRYSILTNSSRVRVEGNSSFGDWRIETGAIEGSIVGGDAFPMSPEEPLASSIADAAVNVVIPTRWLRSVDENGNPNSDAMDVLVKQELRAENHPWITFTLDSLNHGKRGNDGKSVFYQSAGRLVIAGVTNLIKMPVEIRHEGNGRFRFVCEGSFKLSDFNIQPRGASLGGTSITINDEVKVLAMWYARPRTTLRADR